MATDIFARIGDIKGESQDSRHRDEIDVLSWSWGVSQSGTLGHGGGGGEGKATFHDLSFSHRIDKASPLLMKACATGEHVKDATLTQRKSGKGLQEFLVITLSDVLVTNVSDSGSTGGDATSEIVSIAFGKIDVEYRPQRPDGSLDAAVEFVFDLEQNKVG